MWLLLAGFLALGHAVTEPKLVVVRVDTGHLRLRVDYRVPEPRRVPLLRARCDRDRDGRLDETEAPCLAALVVEEATYALRISLDGAAVPWKPRVAQAYHLEGPIDLAHPPAVRLRLEPALPLACGAHDLTIRDATKDGLPVTVRLPGPRRLVLVDATPRTASVHVPCPE